MRLIYWTLYDGAEQCKVHFNSEVNEFRVRLYVNGKALPNVDYFTDDQTDAEQTAHKMVEFLQKSKVQKPV